MTDRNGELSASVNMTSAVWSTPRLTVVPIHDQTEGAGSQVTEGLATRNMS
ncbi:hypothetical protein [Tistrella mobilis]|uniref:hypothetical protein n=1 Tax=Tistrella mobilis TaxID=171437 RepID=UPI0002DA6C3A|nr:hypothetical protein [Tistrella mobilis]